MIILHVKCSEEESINRIEKRSKDNYESNALEAKVYYENLNLLEPIDFNLIKNTFPNIKISYYIINTTNAKSINDSFIQKINK